MAKEMLVNVSEGEECRIALLVDGRLEELYMERASSTSHVGNIYKGRVTNVEASIQAAFIDFGLERNGFLHISDLMPSYFGRRGEDVQEAVGRKLARRDRPPIQRCLRRGDEIIVQIIKEGIGTKGPTLTTYLSIPGRMLVMMPGMGKMGVTRKLEDDAERRRLRQILDSLKPPKDVGFIIRTAGIGKTKLEIQRDLAYLTRIWQNIEKKLAGGAAPVELYTEGDLVTRAIRDVLTTDVERIIVDNEDVESKIKDFLKIAMPRTRNKVVLDNGPVPLFHKYGIEREIEQMHSRHVPLPSGGSLVIDSTEAIVAIDVNSGKFRDHSDAEMTAFKTDMEAADEIPRQLRLRDLGGVIICDFIDLRYERHRRELEHKLGENLRNDRAKTRILHMSQFGIIEMTRQRMRPSLKRSIYFDCPHCRGSGLVKTPESMSLDVMRRLAIAANDQRVVRIELAVCPDVSFYLLNRKRSQLTRLEDQADKRIIIRADAQLGLDESKLSLFDSRDGLVLLDELGMSRADAGAEAERGHGRDGRRGRHRDRDGRDRNRRHEERPGDEHRQPMNEMEISGDDLFDEAEHRADDQDRDDDVVSPRTVHQAAQGHAPLRPSDANGNIALSPQGVARPAPTQTVAGPHGQGGPGGHGSGEGDPAQTGGRRRRRRGGRGRRRGRGGQQGEHQDQLTAGHDAQRGEQRPHGESDTHQTRSSFDEFLDAGSPITEATTEILGRSDDAHSSAKLAVPGSQYDSDSALKGETQIESPASSADADASTAEAEPAAETSEPKARKPRSRGTRGGRGRKPKATVTDAADDDAAKPKAKTPPAKPSPLQRPAPPVRIPPTTQSTAPSTRRASADKHLADDEEVAPISTPRRPRSRLDLDNIPEDF